MRTHTLFSRHAKTLAPYVAGAFSILLFFVIGVRTSGNVQTIGGSLAAAQEEPGDMNGDGQVTVDDVIAVMEVAQGYRSPTMTQLRNDPDHDGRLTHTDALTLLRMLAKHP